MNEDLMVKIIIIIIIIIIDIFNLAYGIRGMAEDKKQLVCQPASLSVY